jgi:hypothetical protein
MNDAARRALQWPGEWGPARQCDDPNTRATYDRLEKGDVRVYDAPRRP